MICVVTLAELLPGLGSASMAETVAVFVALPMLTGTTWMDTVAFAPLASVPIAQLTVAGGVVVQDPTVGVAETSETPVGRGSVSVTPVAEEGPLLVTVTV
jgi:hypothetical protein